MTLPAGFLDSAIAHARAAGRDFDARPLTVDEQHTLTTLWVVGYSPEQAGDYLASGRVRVRAQQVEVGA